MAATCFRSMERQRELLVYPQILEDRDYDGGIVLVVHDGMTIRLEKSYVLGEDFRVTILNGSDSDSVIINEQDRDMDFYRSTEHRSSVFVRRLPTGLEVHGILSNELRITPLDAAERSSDGTPLNKVFKVEDDSDDDGDDDVGIKSPKTSEAHVVHDLGPGEQDEEHGASGPAAEERPETFLVEVCIVTTKNYRSAFKDYVTLSAYFGAMMNSVALRYDGMTNPKIGFLLKASTVSYGRELIQYRNNYVDAINTLKRLVEHLENGGFGICDAVILFTRNAIKLRKHGKARTVRGAAATGSVCTKHGVGIVQDKPLSYSGEKTLAHELAHM
ncbi:uncharacterized protein LOC144103679 [Amblyomma americanum]